MALPVQLVDRRSGKTWFPMFPEKTISWDALKFGINRQKSDKQLLAGELYSALNFFYNDFGYLETRPGLAKVTTSAITGPNADIVQIVRAPVSKPSLYGTATYGSSAYGYAASVNFTLLVTKDHRIYYLNSAGVPTAIGAHYTADGDCYIVAFDEMAVIMDGDYLKYWDGNDLKLAYDDGSGTAGFMFDYTALDQDSTRDLYSGTNTKCAAIYTTPAFNANGLTIPLTQINAMLSKSGSPTGSVYAKLYATAAGAPTGAALATSDAIDVSTLAATAAEIEFTFSGSYYQMASGTAYAVSIEYAGGDSSNYLQVHKSNDSNIEYYDNGSWTVGTHQPLFAMKPGLPPRADFGLVAGNRLFLKDPTNPGRLKYSNADTLFDWSTPNGGGYIGVIDDNSNTFQLGGMATFYGDIFLIGNTSDPYICKLLGVNDGPSAFSVVQLGQRVSSHHNVMVSAMNDIWFASPSNAYAISGVNMYGDIRTFAPGDPVQATIQAYFDESAFAAYWPDAGLYLLKLDGYDRVLAAHTKHVARDATGRIVYPWTEFEFKNLTPTSFSYFDGDFYVGCSNGNLYKLAADVNDDGTLPDYELQPGILELDFSQATANEIYISADSGAAFGYDMALYRNGSAAALQTISITGGDAPTRETLNFDFKSLQWKISNLSITKPLKISGLNLKITPQEI